MALIFDRDNKVSPVCILRRSIWTQLIQKVKIMVTTTNCPARSKWKFVAILFAITVAVSVIVAELVDGKNLLDYFGDTNNSCKWKLTEKRRRYNRITLSHQYLKWNEKANNRNAIPWKKKYIKTNVRHSKKTKQVELNQEKTKKRTTQKKITKILSGIYS